MASLTLFCSKCWTGFASIGEVPVKCPACGRVTRWVTKFPYDVPTKPYDVTANDAKLLRSLHIDPELPPVVGTVEG